MAKGTVNKVTILGRLGQDPEVRYMPNGGAVANLRVATNEGYKDKNTGQYVDSTEWHRIVMFGRLAEIAGEYLKKGRLVYVEGRLRTNKWQDQNGNDRYTTEITANEMQLIGGQGDGGNAGGGNYNQAPAKENYNQSAPQQQQPQTATTAPAPNVDNLDKFDDDDIPF